MRCLCLFVMVYCSKLDAYWVALPQNCWCMYMQVWVCCPRMCALELHVKRVVLERSFCWWCCFQARCLCMCVSA